MPVENMTHVKYNLKEFEGSLIKNTEKQINCTLVNKTLWKYNYFQDERLFTCPCYARGMEVKEGKNSTFPRIILAKYFPYWNKTSFHLDIT